MNDAPESFILHDFSSMSAAMQTELFSFVNESENILLYDTASLLDHARTPEDAQAALANYYKDSHTLLIILGVIVEESSPKKSVLPDKVQEFLQLLQLYGVHILVMTEEALLRSLLLETFNLKMANVTLKRGIDEVMKYAKDSFPFPDFHLPNEPKKLEHSDYINNIFEILKSVRHTGDSKGEWILLFCVSVILKIPNAKKHIGIVTDDRACLSSLGPVIDQLRQKSCIHEPFIITTPRIVDILCKKQSNPITREVALDLLAFISDRIYLCYIGEFDLLPIRKSLSQSEIVDIAMNPTARICY